LLGGDDHEPGAAEGTKRVCCGLPCLNWTETHRKCCGYRIGGCAARRRPACQIGKFGQSAVRAVGQTLEVAPAQPSDFLCGVTPGKR
jgi:hypothetical protein